MKKQQKQTAPKSIRLYRVLRWILIPFVLLVMAVSTAQLIRIVLEYRVGEETYQSVSEQFVSPVNVSGENIHKLPSRSENPNASETPLPQTGEQTAQPQQENPGSTLSPVSAETPQPAATRYAPIQVDFDRLLEMNGECVGWIYIPDTNINYPVMQADNNSKYLTILPDGSKNKAGSIFMDARNDPDLNDCNTVIYGHRLRDGSMFTPLNKYKTRSYFKSHQTVYYLTPDADYEITIFACMTVSAIGDAYEMYNDSESLRTYLRQALQEDGVFDSIDPDQVDRIITLSTCTGNFGTRTVLLGTFVRLG